MIKANITRWHFLVSAMARGGGMCAPVAACRLCRHIGGFGNSSASDSFWEFLMAMIGKTQEG